MIGLALGLACGGEVEDSGGEADPFLSAASSAPPGGWFWVLSQQVDTPPPADVLLDAEPLALAWPAGPHSQFALYQVPLDQPDGTAVLEVGSAAFEFTVSSPWFEDVAEVSGLSVVHDVSTALVACSEAQTGVGFADVDLDGDLDGLFGDFSSPSRLYENQGDRSGDGLPDFVDRTPEWGLPDVNAVAGVFFADWDNDTDPDLFLGRLGTNVVLENRMVPDGVPSWRDVTASSGLGTTDQRTMGAGFGDFDGDGDLDLYEVNHSLCFPDDDPNNDQSSNDHLWRNDGGVFVDVSAWLDPDVLDRFGFSAIWLDLDRDADQDLWVVNDWTVGSGRSAVWRNDGPDGLGGWLFTDITNASGISPATDIGGKTVNAMGGAVGDVNRDGWPDFAFTNIGANQLVLSTGDGRWAAQADALGLSRARQAYDTVSVTWGVHLADLDLDRDLDVVYVGGALKGRDAQVSAFFENTEAGWIERTWSAGLSSPRHGKASAQLDLDGDGYLDLVVAAWGDVPSVWHNLAGRTRKAHWLAIDPVGDGVSVNRDGFGAIVALTFDDGSVDTCFHNPVPSLGGTSDPACWFGLGTATPTALEVIWPDGVAQSIDVPARDQRVKVVR